MHNGLLSLLMIMTMWDRQDRSDFLRATYCSASTLVFLKWFQLLQHVLVVKFEEYRYRKVTETEHYGDQFCLVSGVFCQPSNRFVTFVLVQFLCC